MSQTVSIIMPVYNAEKYLKDTLNSVINQTYKQLEIILVDDGSTDSSGKICDDYAKKDNRIKVFHCENSGNSAARNKGLSAFSGKYVLFLDSDDIFNPSLVEKLVTTIDSTDSDIAICSSFEFSSKESALKDRISLKDTVVDCKNTTRYLNDLYCCVFGKELWNKLLRADTIRKYDIKFKEVKHKILAGQDFNFNLIYGIYVDKFVTLSDSLVKYRLSDTSTYKSYKNKYLMFDNILALKHFKKYSDNYSDKNLNIYFLNIFGDLILKDYYSKDYYDSKNIDKILEVFEAIKTDGFFADTFKDYKKSYDKICEYRNSNSNDALDDLSKIYDIISAKNIKLKLRFEILKRKILSIIH